jgi:RecA-family ATPase
METVALSEFVQVLNEAGQKPEAGRHGQAELGREQNQTETWPNKFDHATRPGSDDARMIKARARVYAARAAGHSEGQRNTAGFALAAALREKFALEGNDLLDVLKDWNEANQPPLDESELRQIAQNADRYTGKAGLTVPGGNGPQASLPALSKRAGIMPAFPCTAGDAAMSLAVITADRIEPQELTWFWPNRIPAGMYSFIVGDPGAGKSFLSCYLAAVATTGGVWADGAPIDVLMFVSEDHLAKTLVQRLTACGADLSRVSVCQWVQTADAVQVPFVIQENIRLLEAYLNAHPRCKLATLDPITGYLGDANQNSQADVRQALLPVKELAERHEVTVIGFSHLNKKIDLQMQHRSIGSVAFNAVPRAVWGVFAMDETNDFQFSDFQFSILKTENDTLKMENGNLKIPPRKRYFFPIKDNLCDKPDALEFAIDGGRVRFARRLSAADVRQAMNPEKAVPRRLSKKEQAKGLILDLLNSGSIESDALIQKVMEQGMSERTVLNARTELRDAGKVDCHNPDGKGYRWFIVEEL